MNIYEQKIIGGIAAGIITPTAAGLDAADFSDRDLGVVFNLARALEAEGADIDADILYSRSIETNAFFTAEDFRLMAASASSRSVCFDAVARIKADSLKSFLLERSAQIALDKAKSGAALLDDLKQIVSEAEKFYATGDNSFRSLTEIAPEVEALLRDLHAGVSYAVPTYFPSIDDKLTDGFSKGDLHVIVGQTGHGKSALALNFALNQAKNNHPVGFVSREMSSSENILRFLASESGVPRWQIRKDMFDSTFQTLLDALAELKHEKVYFDERTEDIETLLFEARRLKEEKLIDILYVDYLQLLTSKEKTDTRANEVQHISRELKKLAMSLKIPVVALVQFNNGIRNATVYDAMDYIRESGSIKQDASTIQYIQIEQTDAIKEFKDAKNTILKNRNGATFQPVELRYQGANFKFYE